MVAPDNWVPTIIAAPAKSSPESSQNQVGYAYHDQERSKDSQHPGYSKLHQNTDPDQIESQQKDSKLISFNDIV